MSSEVRSKNVAMRGKTYKYHSNKTGKTYNGVEYRGSVELEDGSVIVVYIKGDSNGMIKPDKDRKDPTKPVIFARFMKLDKGYEGRNCRVL
jgi:hypothetical protein